MMNITKRYFLPLIAVAIATSISSCSSNSTARQNVVSETPAPTATSNITSSPSPSPSQTSSMAQLRAKSDNIATPAPKEAPTESTPAPTIIETPSPEASPTDKSVTEKTTNVTLYTSDVQCQQLIPQKVPVPVDKPVAGAVSKILEQRDSGDFNLSSYRVNVKNGVATVDFRVAPNSKRQIASLSSCEQFAMFGSLRKTLTSNPQWKIKEVRFTERGQEIVL